MSLKQVRHPRVQAYGTAFVFTGNRRSSARMLNVSLTGMLLVCPIRFRLDLPLRIEFVLVRVPSKISVRARAVREHPGGNGYIWGIRFAGLDKELLSYLEGYVKRRLALGKVA